MQESSQSKSTSITPPSNESSSERLLRFFLKLFSESSSLNADNICFSSDGDAVTVSIRKGTVDIKSLKIRASWYELIATWLSERNFPFFPNTSQLKSATNEFSSATRIEDKLVIYKVRLHKKSILLSDFQTVPLHIFLAQLHISSSTISLLCKASKNMFIVSAKTDDSLALAKALILCCTNSCYVDNISQLNDIQKFQDGENLLSAIKAEDASDILFNLKDLKLNLEPTPPLTLICLGFARKVCKHCGREAVVDKALLEFLPESMRVHNHPSYKVGRGCIECDSKGFKGWVVLESLVVVDTEICDLLKKDESQVVLLNRAYAKGTRSLLQNGADKAFAGLLTLEALFEVVKVLPPLYTRIISDSSKSKNLAIPDNYFAQDSSSAPTKPRYGKSVFNASEANDENAPLFSTNRPKKAREKPLLLVVEDDLDQQSILEMVLKSAQYEVMLANNGVEAIKHIESEIPDLILTDLMMPQMDGKELVAKLKHNELYRRIPVIVLTVISDSDKEYDLLDLGADDYCEKTVQRKILLKRIENLLKRSKKN